MVLHTIVARFKWMLSAMIRLWSHRPGLVSPTPLLLNKVMLSSTVAGLGWSILGRPSWGDGVQTAERRITSVFRVLLTGSKPVLALSSQAAGGGDRWLLMAVRRHLGDKHPVAL